MSDTYSSQTEMEGLFATWVTPELVAMSRPSSRIIKDYDLIGQFKKSGVQHIFNLSA